MKSKYPHIFAPLALRGYVLKNRLESANSMPHFIQGPETYPGQGTITHFANRAKSGAAIVSISNFSSGPHRKNFDMDMDFSHMPHFDIFDTESQNYLLHLTDTIHFHGSIANACLMWGPPDDYMLRYKKGGELPPPPGANGVAGDPTMSFVPTFEAEYEYQQIPSHLRPAEYTEEQLDQIAEAYAQQAAIVRKLDFDMISLHFAYRMNLPSKMFSPLANNRTDGWNGSLENRMKYPLLVLRKVREAIGPNAILEILWSFEDLPGGYTIDDTVAFLNQAKQYVDIVQLRANDGVPAHPTSFELKHEPFLEQAAYIKQRVPGLLIAGIAGYFDPEVMERSLAEGKLDLIAQGRAWISNPDYGHKLLEGRAEDLVPCLRCNRCHGRSEGDPYQSVCSVNPLIGMEHELQHLIRPVERKKRVAVIGGGPGGMRCALDLADRGHDVVLYEASDALGGAIKHADYADFKWTLKQFKDYLIAQVGKRNNIQVRLNTPATPALIEAEQFDAVVAALGGVPVRPPIQGLDQVKKVWYSAEAYGGAEQMGQNVVVIGGGEVGLEAGIRIAQTGRQATVLEMRPMLAMDATKIHYREQMDEMWQKLPNFTGLVNVTVTAVTDHSVTYVDQAGQSHTLPADDIVVAAGMKGQTERALAFYGSAPEFYLLGDCKKPGTIQTTIRQAFAVASGI